MKKIPPMPIRQYSELNRKRHSSRNKWLWRVCAISLALAATTCAPSNDLRNTPIPRPAESKPVSPTADRARQQVTQAHTTSTELHYGLTKAVAEADRLRRQKAASEAELQELWAILTKEQERAAALWKQLSESQNTIEQLQRDANAADVEINQLRMTVDTLNARLNDEKKWRAKAEPKVAVYDAVSRSLRWILFGVFVVTALYVVLRYWPAIAARFVKPI